MKAFRTIIIIVATLFWVTGFSQVAINETNHLADQSAMLDVESTSKGFLPPRMTEIEKLRIDNPAEGLIIFNTDSLCLNFYNGTTWVGFNDSGTYEDPLDYQIAIGGTGDDAAYDIIQTSDGGFLMVGSTSSYGAGEGDFYIVKLDADFQFDPAFGTGGTFVIGSAANDVARGVVELADGSFVISGYSYGLGAGVVDIYTVKISSTGILDNTFGTNGTLTIGASLHERGYGIISTSDGGFLFTGYSVKGVSDYDAYIVKVTAAGALDAGFGTNGIFRIGGSGNEYTYKAQETSDGGFIVIASTASYGAGGMDVYVIKLTSAGALDNSFGTNGTLTIGGGADDWGGDIAQTSDGGYLLCGITGSFGQGGNDMYVVKLSSTGTLDNSFGTNGTLSIGGTGAETGNSLLLLSDGSCIVGGYTDSYGAGGIDMYLVKLDASGNPDTDFGTDGTLTIGGASNDYMYNISEVSGGGYLVCGYTQSFGSGGNDAFIIRLNVAGKTCGNMGSGGDYDNGGALGSGGTVTAAGTTGSGGTTSSGGVITAICQ